MRAFRLAAALLAIAAGCGPVGRTTESGSPQGEDPPARDFSPFDLEFQWRGISDPFHPGDRPLELTLAFDAWGAGNNAVALTRYTFPHPFDPDQIVQYHDLIDTYDLFLYADGRFVLDTVYDYAVGTVFVVEKVFKELRMNEERTRLEGVETIEVYENGQLTISYAGWLTLDREL
jgi:hypothetical protein